MTHSGGKYDIIAESVESATGNVHPRSLTPQNRGSRFFLSAILFSSTQSESFKEDTTLVSIHQNGRKYGVKDITPLRRQMGFDKSGTELKRRLHSPANNNRAATSSAYLIGVDTMRKSKSRLSHR